MEEPVETWTVAVTADTSQMQRELAAASLQGQRFSRTLASAFEGVAFKGKGLGEVFRSLAASLAKMALQAAFKPLDQVVGNLFSGLTRGIGGFGQGAAVTGGLPVPFAAGGVISSPIAFPLAGGRRGIAGERGAEAIMPLGRTRDGRLGVVGDGMGAGMSVTFNVTTPDAESFKRSETQIAALLARSVARGQRNL